MEIEAIYEGGGIVKLPAELPLKNGQKIRLTIHDSADRVKSSYGLIPWLGSDEDLENLLGPENQPEGDS